MIVRHVRSRRDLLLVGSLRLCGKVPSVVRFRTQDGALAHPRRQASELSGPLALPARDVRYGSTWDDSTQMPQPCVTGRVIAGVGRQGPRFRPEMVESTFRGHESRFGPAIATPDHTGRLFGSASRAFRRNGSWSFTIRLFSRRD